MRLNRFLASAGFGSRRGCEEIIRGGRVTVNDRRCVELATDVNPGADRVAVDGRPAHTEALTYLALHKPTGFVTSANDENGRRTVFDLLPPEGPRLFHIGRLDRESEGLLLFTNDGDLAQRLTHPRHEVDKEYEVTLDRVFNPADAARLIKGVFIPVDEGGPPAPVAERSTEGVRHVRARAASIQPGGLRTVRVILHQGFKRQLRLMFYEVGYEVERLVRVRFGAVELGRLKPGRWRELDVREVASLRSGKPLIPREPRAAPASRPPVRLRPPASRSDDVRPARTAPSARQDGRRTPPERPASRSRPPWRP